MAAKDCRRADFAAFVDGICTTDCLRRVRNMYGLERDEYVFHIWQDVVRGHVDNLMRRLNAQHGPSPKHPDIVKLRQELADALDYGRALRWETELWRAPDRWRELLLL